MNEIDAVSSHILTWGNEQLNQPASKVNWDMVVYEIILSLIFTVIRLIFKIKKKPC